MNLGYDVQLTLWFDGGKGQTEKYGDVQIAYSSKNQIVDDKLVQMFGGDLGRSGNFLVVTSDRNLTLRLHDVGVKVMKSGRFYKQYLKVNEQQQNAVEKMDVDGNDDKECTPEGDGGDNDDETDDCSPDEVEGGNHQYSSPIEQDAEDGEDSDYFEIFGDEEDMESE